MYVKGGRIVGGYALIVGEAGVQFEGCVFVGGIGMLSSYHSCGVQRQILAHWVFDWNNLIPQPNEQQFRLGYPNLVDDLTFVSCKLPKCFPGKLLNIHTPNYTRVDSRNSLLVVSIARYFIFPLFFILFLKSLIIAQHCVNSTTGTRNRNAAVRVWRNLDNSAHCKLGPLQTWPTTIRH